MRPSSPLIRALLRTALGLVLLQASAGCAALAKLDAPRLAGSPDSTGLVVVDSEAEVIAALFGVRSKATPTGGVLARMDGDQSIAYGRTAHDLVVFSGLAPGRWRLVAIDADWRAGSKPGSLVFHKTLEVGDREAPDFTFDVRAGEPLYVGRVKIEDDARAESRGVRFERVADRQAELRAWRMLAAIYDKGPWASRLRTRL